MKVLVLFVVLSLSAFGVEKGIYGADNRVEIFEVDDSMLLKAADATAAMISRFKLGSIDDEIVITDTRTLREKRFVCSDEPFASQMAPVDCSAFLVAPDIIVTAGHCMAVKDACKNNVWVFGYYADEDGKAPLSLSKENIYTCKTLVEGSLDPFYFGRDHAVIKLDRPVTGREPLKYRKRGVIENDSELMLVGNPSGLPTKIARDGFVRKNDNPYWFSTSLDAFGGNSGSAVINMENGFVEGILVRGDEDFYYDRYERCFRSAQYPMLSESGMGEHVTRITNSPYLQSL